MLYDLQFYLMSILNLNGTEICEEQHKAQHKMLVLKR